MKQFLLKSLKCIACVVAWASLSVAAQAGSIIYQWRDERGRLHFTDNPSAIPVQYWSQVQTTSSQADAASSARSRSIRLVIGEDQKAIQVPVSLNRTGTFLAYLDTGATYCQITREDVEMLGIQLHEQPRVKVIMADGRTQEAPIVILESMVIGSVEIKKIEAIVGDLRLIGLNALKRLKLTIDLPRGEVLLESEQD